MPGSLHTVQKSWSSMFNFDAGAQTYSLEASMITNRIVEVHLSYMVLYVDILGIQTTVNISGRPK